MEESLNLIFGYFGGGFSLNQKPYEYLTYSWNIGEDEPSILGTWNVWWLYPQYTPFISRWNNPFTDH